MTVIRRAIKSDIPAMVEMGRSMIDESPRYRSQGVNVEKLHNLAMALVTAAMPGGVLVAEKEGVVVGMLAFHIGQHFFNDVTFASDLVMYIRPEHRSGSIFPKLVTAFEAWADEYGVGEKQLGVSAEIDSQRIVAALERMGYKQVATGTSKF